MVAGQQGLLLLVLPMVWHHHSPLTPEIQGEDLEVQQETFLMETIVPGSLRSGDSYDGSLSRKLFFS